MPACHVRRQGHWTGSICIQDEASCAGEHQGTVQATCFVVCAAGGACSLVFIACLPMEGSCALPQERRAHMRVQCACNLPEEDGCRAGGCAAGSGRGGCQAASSSARGAQAAASCRLGPGPGYTFPRHAAVYGASTCMAAEFHEDKK